MIAVVGTKLRAAGHTADQVAAMPEADRLAAASGFFGGGHDVIVARRHFVDGAADDHRLAGAGTLTPDEHHQFLRFTADTARDLYTANPHARYVSVFQNWLAPAGASFDHLHKQAVAVDEVGAQNEAALARVREDREAFNTLALDPAVRHGLIVAENEHAVLFAGFGHRYPCLEVYSTSARCEPWAHEPHEQRAVSDLLHAAHATTGADVPADEEWHTRPAGVVEPLPWRICLKWRVSTLAGFEGALGEGIRIGDDARARPGMLRYARPA